MSAGEAKPTERLERALQASLQPVDPGEDFTARLQARLATAALQPPGHAAQPSAGHPRWRYSASLALAASIVMAVAVGWQLQDLHVQRQADQVRLQQTRVQTQLLLALEITSERLGEVQQRLEQYQLQEKSL
jgi:anti-sigma-K factor RskA